MLPNDPRPTIRIDVEGGFYPIVYVRGFAMTAGLREGAFYDAYYGYAETSVEKRDAYHDRDKTSVEKRDAPPKVFLEPLVFEGQLIRFLKEYGYVDAANGGLKLVLSSARGAMQNPTRSLWISRFYDRDVMFQQVRSIEEHAEDLRKLICEDIPKHLTDLGNVDLGENNQDYKVILIAHSMGGLVCRCLIQNKLKDPERWIHRLVTIATPHKGIELSVVPDFLEELVIGKGNVFSAAIFKEERMRQYLNLNKKDAAGKLLNLHSLMRQYLNLNKKDAAGKLPNLHSLNGTYPEGRCLCIIGSDHDSYAVVQKATGDHSDGLVKQSRAYIDGAYWANVHRAHSGRKGIVNSFETYENIRRFLFGDTRVRLWLEDLSLKLDNPPENITEFYDIEFSLSVRGTGVFLHQRKQNPCENAQRFDRDEFPLKSVHLHTGFMDTKLRPTGDKFSHFLLELRIVQHRVQEGFRFDHQYPERTIYSESMEVRVNLDKIAGDTVQYRWLSETTNLEDPSSWQQGNLSEGVFRFPFRKAETLEGVLCIKPGPWPDKEIDQLRRNAAQA